MKKPFWRSDFTMAVLGIFSIGLVYWAEAPSTTAELFQVLIWVDLAVVVLFLADWFLMLREAKNRKQWALWNLWRLLGMVPLALTNLGFLRLLRLTRVAPVLMRVPAIRRGLRKLLGRLKGADVLPLALSAISITLLGSLLVWLAEKDTNPALENFGEALWWAIVTVTTVGYGDITPQSSMGRTVAVFLMVTGIGTIGLLASQVGSAIAHPTSLLGNSNEAGSGQGGELSGAADAASEANADSATAVRPPQDAGIGTQLTKLASLHANGQLTDEEFAAAKQRVLQ